MGRDKWDRLRSSEIEYLADDYPLFEERTACVYLQAKRMVQGGVPAQLPSSYKLFAKTWVIGNNQYDFFARAQYDTQFSNKTQQYVR